MGGQGTADDGALPDTPRPFAARRLARVDALIDAIATVAPEAPVTGELALQHLPASRRAGTKPFHIEGLNAETAEWEAPRPGQRYGEFQAPRWPAPARWTALRASMMPSSPPCCGPIRLPGRWATSSNAPGDMGLCPVRCLAAW